MFYSNVDCLTKEKKSELEILLINEKVDIIGLTEISPKHSSFENVEQHYELKTYNLFTNNLNDGCGVAIYVRAGLCAERVTLQSDFKESVWCRIKLRNNDSLLIGCVYRSPSSVDTNSRELLNLFEIARDSRDSHKLIMGDFNLKEINWEDMSTSVGETHLANLFVECVRDSYFIQHITEPTRIRAGQEPSVLDLIFTNEDDMVSEINLLPSIGKSDHVLISFNFNCYITSEFENSQQTKYNFHRGDYQSINANLSSLDWDDEFNGLDLSRSWSRLTEIYIKLVEDYIPVSGSRLNREDYIPYLTQSCFDAIRSKHQKWLKFKHCQTEENFNIYKTARNRVTAEVRKAKYEYEKNLSAKIKTDNKIFWSYVRKHTKTKTVVSKLQMPNGELSSTSQETANTLNNYFASVFKKENLDNIPNFDDRPFNQTIETVNITKELVEKAIKRVNPTKSQGPDKIHPRFIEQTKDNIIEPLTKIFKKSMAESKIPDIWKSANVTAIFKKGERKNPANYRPISLTSVPGKIMERLIRNALVEHMADNNLFTPEQHGFISGKSCTTQLLEYMEDITQAIDNGDDVDVIYLDFCKAFDRVPHTRLLHKLHGYGIRGELYNWIKDFLSNRIQRVVVNGAESDWQEVTSGIPQGSVLGPVLFLIFINDLPDVLEVCVKLFADDTKLYKTIKNQHDRQPVQRSVTSAAIWAIDWDMEFNNTKCHHLHIGKHDSNLNYTIEHQGTDCVITKVDSEKDLGVTIDKNLNFREHISSKINLANRNVGIIFRTFTYLDPEMFKNLYKSIVRPHLEYGTVIWSPMYKKDKIAIENVQRRATKLVRSCKDLSYPERLRKLGLPSLEYRRERSDLIQVYKILNDIDKMNKDKLFTLSAYGATRGHPKKIFKERPRLNIRANSFPHRVVNTWNNLPEHVVMAPSVNAFKSRLNTHWKGHPHKFEPACYETGTNTGQRNYIPNASLQV